MKLERGRRGAKRGVGSEIERERDRQTIGVRVNGARTREIVEFSNKEDSDR